MITYMGHNSKYCLISVLGLAVFGSETMLPCANSVWAFCTAFLPYETAMPHFGKLLGHPKANLEVSQRSVGAFEVASAVSM